MMQRFKGKVCVVTGAGSGIGRATALAFAREGANVLAADLNAANGEAVVAEIMAASGTALFMAVDIAGQGQVEAMVARAVSDWGRLDCAVNCAGVTGCDGYHGISRATLPPDSYREHRIEYPFSWLGILAHAAPSSDELIYAYHERGFALHSLRSPSVSRLYIQVGNDDHVDNWPDERVWDELQIRLSDGTDFRLNRGTIFEKSITPMRSFMIDNMQHGRLFLTGDAAHIVPPTGGKGLNLAVADVKLLGQALTEHYQSDSDDKLTSYTADCLRRVWRVQDFSNTMTYLFHKQAPHGSFENQLQKARFDYIARSPAMATTIAENYVGLTDL